MKGVTKCAPSAKTKGSKQRFMAIHFQGPVYDAASATIFTSQERGLK